MRNVKQFSNFLKDGTVKKAGANKERAKSLVLESERKMQSLQEQLDKIGIKDQNANDYVEYCYDIVMPLVRALLFLNGYHSSGQGAHEAEVSYLRELGFSEKDLQFADQMRYFRNGILYYGTNLDEEYAQLVISFTKRIVPTLKRLIKEE